MTHCDPLHQICLHVAPSHPSPSLQAEGRTRVVSASHGAGDIVHLWLRVKLITGSVGGALMCLGTKYNLLIEPVRLFQLFQLDISVISSI